MTLNSWTLYNLCNKNNYFTCGTNEQYDKLFEANKFNAPIDDLATIIWICSDENIRRRDIKENLKKAREQDIKKAREQDIENYRC